MLVMVWIVDAGADVASIAGASGVSFAVGIVAVASMKTKMFSSPSRQGSFFFPREHGIDCCPYFRRFAVHVLFACDYRAGVGLR